MSRTWTAALALALLLVQTPADAHPVPFSYLDIRLQPGAIAGTLVVHILDVAHDLSIASAERLLDPGYAATQLGPLTRLMGERLQIGLDGRAASIDWLSLEVAAERQSLKLHFRIPSSRVPASMQVAGSLFPYDANHKTFVNVYEGDALTQSILDRSRTTFDYFAGTRQGTFAVVRKFLPSGVHHILIGPDHLLFLIGLLLLGGSLKRLLLIVTGFTVAHSITLTLAALNLVSPPASVIEPAIALSIIYVGVDNLMVRKGRDLRPWIALAFGLVHGFGFANVLREMDLPSRALGWSLLSFNFGVEIGQLLVVVVTAGVLAWVRAWNPDAGRRVAVAGSVAVIGAGGFWFVERVFLSGGIR
ncbi:MAG TPA: HupE/UreJ family protein [Vicinamibacterales bacterium]|nr:HupE/UreJ family protein [Vicinamibacterales bacterium]